MKVEYTYVHNTPRGRDLFRIKTTKKTRSDPLVEMAL